jgi:hypothetical protein
MKAKVLSFADRSEPHLAAYLAKGKTTDQWKHDWELWHDLQKSPIAEFARALDAAPKLADVPFALVSEPVSRRAGKQGGLF